MAVALQGVDVSSWQHVNGAAIDWEKVREAGYSFALVKATQGTSYSSPFVRADLAGARAAGLLVGAYHYFEAGVEAGEQAEWFGGSIAGEVLELGAWLDFEPPGLEGWAGAGAIATFFEGLSKYRDGGYLYVDQSRLADLKTANVAYRRLWLAAPSLTSAPEGAFLWQQRAQEVPGLAGPVDVDVLLSTRGVNLATLASPVPATEPQEAPEEPEAPIEPAPEPEPSEEPVGAATA